MAITATYTQKFREKLVNGQINFGTVGTGQGNPDSFVIILMNNTYSFSAINHTSYADVSSYELTTNYGYTIGGQSLGSLTIARDDNIPCLNISYATITWQALNGNIGPSPGAIIFDDTPPSTSNKWIVGYLSFGGQQTAYDGGYFTISSGLLKIT